MTASRKELNRLRTIADIEGAFLTLYARVGIDGVSIADLCKACGISRSTFYLYFEDKYAVLQSAEDRLLSELWEICGVLPDRIEPEHGTSTAERTIAHIRTNIDWYRALLGQHGDPRFIYRWKRDIDRSLRALLQRRNTSDRDMTIQGVLFASALIGLYTYVVFEYSDISDDVLVHYMDQLLGQVLLQ